MPTEDRRVGKQLPIPVTPAGTVCFKIEIPNAVQYRAAFLGQINILGQALTWDHPTDGTVCLPCEEAAQLWRDAIYNATWSDECGDDPMSCADVADCIENDAATQAAIVNVIINEGGTSVYDTSLMGTPMSQEMLNRGVGKTKNGDCNSDSLFGSVTYIVDQLNTNNLDFLEVIIPLASNASKIENVTRAIPLLNKVPAAKVIEFTGKMAEEIKGYYESQYTESLRDTYRCDLFCIAKDNDDCELTFQAMFDYFENRLGFSLDPENLFGDLVEYFTLGTWVGTQVVDVMTLIQITAWREASNWSGVTLRSLETIGLLGANDYDHDWAIIPCECEEDECEDLTTGTQDWIPLDAVYGTYYPGEGWGRGTEVTRVGLQKQYAGETITSYTVTTNMSMDGYTIGVFPGYNIFGGETFRSGSGTSFTITGSFTAGIAWEIIDYSTLPAGFRVIEICVVSA